MKKSLVLFALAFLFVGFSQAFAQAELGTWKITSIDLKTSEDEADNTAEAKEMEEAIKSTKGTFTFGKGGAFSMDVQSKGGEPVTHTNKYKHKDGKLSFAKESMDLVFFDGAILKIAGNKATLTQPDMDGASITFNLEKTK